MTKPGPKPKMAQLSAPQLAKEVGLFRQTVETVLKNAKIEPVFCFKVGAGYTNIFDRATAEAAIADYKAAKLAKAAKRDPAVVPSAPISLSALEKQLAVNDTTLFAITGHVEELTRQLGLLIAQNQVLCKKLEKIEHYTEQLHTELTPTKA